MDNKVEKESGILYILEEFQDKWERHWQKDLKEHSLKFLIIFTQI